VALTREDSQVSISLSLILLSDNPMQRDLIVESSLPGDDESNITSDLAGGSSSNFNKAF
jgi:hypothetical protein